MHAADPLLTVERLRVSTRAGDILRGVDLTVSRGEVLGLVGESGSGKTTLGLALIGLLGRARAITGGEVRLAGSLVSAAGVDRTAALRGARITYVPQDPFRAFDPLRRMGPQVRRPLVLHRGLDGAAADARVRDLLARLGVREPETLMSRYPHQLSGGLLQRAAIATALSCGPELVIADEPTSALDVIVRSHVLEAFASLVRDLGTAVIVISHDLRLLERLAHRIAVMYAGRIVEFGAAAQLLTRPRHPYPAALLRASLRDADPRGRLPTVEGQPPSLPGSFAPCAYAPRCPRADERCWTEEPWYDWPAATGKACHHPITGPVDSALAARPAGGREEAA
jgi:oligopeptide/dipeptide ABC transporter ATP-binding protein